MFCAWVVFLSRCVQDISSISQLLGEPITAPVYDIQLAQGLLTPGTSMALNALLQLYGFKNTFKTGGSR